MKKILLLLSPLFLLFACNSENGVMQTETGLKYKFHVQTNEGFTPQLNDVLTVAMAYSINDSVLFDSKMMKQPMQFPLMPPSFKGDFFEGIAMMRIGDSASFWSRADSVMLKVFHTGVIPPFVKKGDLIRFDVSLLDFSSQEEFANKQMKMLEDQKNSSGDRLLAYIEEQGITASPTSSGLYYVETEEGKGKNPTAGQRVSVHYTGTLLDGIKFDSSHDRGQPIVFTLGVGQVIKGWDEGIALMKQGGKARLVIPSELAYGERDMGSIPPYSPLVFDVELVSIIE